MTSPRRHWITATALLLALAGCGTTDADPVSGVSLAPPTPVGVATVRPGTTASAPAGPTCNPLASLRPAPQQPRPGAMPAGSTMAAIVRRGYLIAGVDQDSYLFGYRNPSTKPGQSPVVGFDIDVLHEVARALFGDPNRIRFQLVTQDQRISAVTSGQVDIVADSMTMTCDRERQVAFSTDYFDAGQRLLVKTSSGVRDIADLAGRKVCAAAGTTSIQTLAEPRFHVTPVSAITWTDCLVLLQQDAVAAVSTDDSILVGLEIQDPYTTIVGPRFTQEPHGLAMSKTSPDFVRFVNGVLDHMRTAGTWTQLYRRWLGTRMGPVPAPPQPTYAD
ncbi:MAG TPA: glutamate ABC transporter substrate-binding protein [Pseudonocardiaceae bacterium]|jgi:polar amino acid transport system substrate-binding protein|nr:glutamate ABC transporter substrate-binding protein [Pseudonocardiaceae bacterium]